MCSADTWSSYNEICKAKLQLRPTKESIHINDFVAQVPLQVLLNHTAKRIIKMQEEEIFLAMDAIQYTESKLTYFWDFDDNTSRFAYKQQYVQ